NAASTVGCSGIRTSSMLVISASVLLPQVPDQGRRSACRTPRRRAPSSGTAAAQLTARSRTSAAGSGDGTDPGDERAPADRGGGDELGVVGDRLGLRPVLGDDDGVLTDEGAG